MSAAVDGLPPTNDFSAICEYVRDWMLRKYQLEWDDEINCGYCFIWAYLVWALWPQHDEVKFVTASQHVVILHKDKYYDCEHCFGEEYADEFCGFGEYSREKRVSIKWMCWLWARNGVKLKEFRRLMRKCTPKLYEEVRDNGKAFWKNHEYFSSVSFWDKIPEEA